MFFKIYARYGDQPVRLFEIPYILNSTATFHKNTLSLDEMKKMVFSDNNKYKSLIISNETDLCGYCMLLQHSERRAYDNTAGIAIYLKPDYINKGIGSIAVDFLEEIAKAEKIHVLIASICGENKSSIKLFGKKDYTKCGHFKEVGEKFGKLLDVVYYQKIF